MTTFMEKMAAGQLSQSASGWLSAHRAARDLGTGSFHIQEPTAADRRDVMPIAGVNGATQEQADRYWANKHQELSDWSDKTFGEGSAASRWIQNYRKNKGDTEYNRGAMERAVGQAVDKAKEEIGRNTGWSAGMRNNYSSSQGTLGGFGDFRRLLNGDVHDWRGFVKGVTGAVNPIGLVRDTFLARNYVNQDWVRRVNSQPLSSNPVIRARQLAYRDELAGKVNPMASTLRRQEHAAGHVEGSFVNGTIGWAVNPVLKRLPGQQYNDLTHMMTGTDTNQQASAYGDAYAEDFGEDAARRAERWLRGAGMGAYIGGAALSAYATGGLSAKAQAAARSLGAGGTIARLGGIGLNAVNSYRKWMPISEGLHQAARVADEGGRAENGKQQVAGMLLDLGGDFAGMMPLSNVADDVVGMGAKALMGTKSVGKALGVTKSMVSKLPGMGSGGAMRNIARNGARIVSTDIVQGISNGVEDDIRGFTGGEKPQGSVLDRYTNGFLSGMVVKPALKGFLNKFDATAPMMNSGDGAAEQQASIDELMADPEALQQFKDGLGDPNMTDDQALAVMPKMLAAQRYVNSMMSALSGLDKDFDWVGCTPEEYQAKWNSYTPEQRGDALFKAFRNDAATGGYVAPEVFNNPDMSQEQKKQLLSMYLRSEDDATGGTMVGQMFRGSKRVALSAMRNSQGARDACVAYASGLVESAINNPGGFDPTAMDDTAKAVLDELTPDEMRQVMMPITNAPPERILEMQQALGVGTDSRFADAGRAAIMYRLSTDGNFAADFIPKYTEAVQNSQGISDTDSAKMMGMIGQDDIQGMFDTMDDDKFTTFARWALSGKGMDAMSGMGDAQGEELKAQFTEAARQRAWEAVKNNPLKNMPAMAGLWLQSKGWNGMASMMANPMVFYGITALLLGGAVWLGKGLFGGSDDDDDDGYIGSSADAISKMQKQRALLVQDIFG